jgi:hypothetical protein
MIEPASLEATREVECATAIWPPDAGAASGPATGPLSLPRVDVARLRRGVVRSLPAVVILVSVIVIVAIAGVFGSGVTAAPRLSPPIAAPRTTSASQTRCSSARLGREIRAVACVQHHLPVSAVARAALHNLPR